MVKASARNRPKSFPLHGWGGNVLFSASLSKHCSLALAQMRDVTLPHLLLHLPTCRMLRCRIFSCTCPIDSCSTKQINKRHVDKDLFKLFATKLQKWGSKEILSEKVKFWKWWRAESPANTIESVFRHPSSLRFVAILQIAMLTRHCEGWRIHDTLLLKMLILSGAPSARVTIDKPLSKTPKLNYAKNRALGSIHLLFIKPNIFAQRSCFLRGHSHDPSWPNVPTTTRKFASLGNTFDHLRIQLSSVQNLKCHPLKLVYMLSACPFHGFWYSPIHMI